MELGKVPSSTKKGKDRKNSKDLKTKVTGLEETKKENKKEKKTGQKRRKRWVQRRPEKGSISSVPSRSAILDPSSLRRKGQGG